MNTVVWGLEWRLALARRRLFLLNMIIPFVLVAPVAWSGAPPAHKAAVFSVLFGLFGTFGSAIPLLRDGERGILRRVWRTGLSPAGHLLQRACAGTALDMLQLGPSLLAVAIVGTTSFSDIPLLVLVMFGSLLFANLLGLWVAGIARSIAEGALFATVSTLLLLHASGVFRTPRPGSVWESIEAWSPFRALHEMMSRYATGSSAGLDPGAIRALAVVALASVILSIWAARPVLERLCSRGRG